MEQADQLEEMHEQRVVLLTRSIRKVVQSKKRRREEGEVEEVSGVNEVSRPLYCHIYMSVGTCQSLVSLPVCTCVGRVR